MWHTRLPEPAGERPLQPILKRLYTAEGPDWLLAVSIGSEQTSGPLATRVLTLNADSSNIGLDFTFPTDRVAEKNTLGHLSITAYDEGYATAYTVLIDPRTGTQQRFDNPEVRTKDFLFIDYVIVFYEGLSLSYQCR